MRRKDDHPFAAQFNQQISESDPFTRIKTGRRFVDNQYSWQVKQDLCNPDSLLHTPGESSDFIILPIPQVD